MAKLIFTSRYMRDAPPGQLQNYVRYIGTREGVEKIDESKKNLPATIAQKKLIVQILKDMPDTKDMLEYEDYKLHPTIGNASEFITQAIEQNVDITAQKENYVDYLANRPRVERIGEHGLFTDDGEPVILTKVQEEVVKHKGPVWTHVVSLRREDAARLGYDSGKQWMALLRSKRAMLCKNMKIDSENLRWYTAFHNESHHPHVHIMVYSAKDNDGYLTKAGIEAMRSELAHDIFRQDFAQIYEGQNQSRSDVKQKAAEKMQEFVGEMEAGVCRNPVLEEKLRLLMERLRNTGGKKVYGYLKADVKVLVDQIVDELAKDPKVAEAYQAWGEWQDQIQQTYSAKRSGLPPLSRQKTFKSIKNMVIAEALALGSHHFSMEELTEEYGEEENGQSETEGLIDSEEIPEPDMFAEAAGNARNDRKMAANADWSGRYKLAREYLYGSRKVKQDFKEAFRLFSLEAADGNALAMYDLGRMSADVLGREADPDAAQEWYVKALDAFKAVERSLPEKKRTYLQYRIGKMYTAGLGTLQDYEAAADWYQKAVLKGHKYAQYSLAGLYSRGQGIAQDFEKAFQLYSESAGQGNPYASYELGKMWKSGTGTQPSEERAESYFWSAFLGFRELRAEMCFKMA